METKIKGVQIDEKGLFIWGTFKKTKGDKEAVGYFKELLKQTLIDFKNQDKTNINYLGVDFVKKSQELKCKGCKKEMKHNQWNFNNYCSDCVKDWKTDTI